METPKTPQSPTNLVDARMIERAARRFAAGMFSLFAAVIVVAICAVAFVGYPVAAGVAEHVTPLVVEHVKTALTPGTLEAKIAGALTTPPTRLTSTSISNAAWAEFPATDNATIVAANELARSDLVQMLVVTNLEAVGRICIETTARTDSDCGNDTAPTSTCDAAGAAGDADIVLAGTQREFRFDGNRCIWFMGSVANADAQLSLVVR